METKKVAKEYLQKGIPFTPQRLEKREKQLSKICGLKGLAVHRALGDLVGTNRASGK